MKTNTTLPAGTYPSVTSALDAASQKAGIETKPTQPDGPRIYVASLSDYNAALVHGRWIACTDLEHVQSEVRAMLAESPTAAKYGETAEEYAIHGFEGFGACRLSEYHGLSEVVELAEAIEEHGEAYTHFLSYYGDTGTPEDFEEAYCGEWESFQQYAEKFFDDVYSGEVPDFLVSYIDYDAFARDLQCDYWTAECSDGGVYVFRCI